MPDKSKPADALKVGDKVHFRTMHASGTGVVTGVRATLRGDQYELEVDGGKARCVRLAQLSRAK